MPVLKLDILVFPTYNVQTLGIADSSVYPTPNTIVSPTIEITVPGFAKVSLPFTINDFTIYNSSTLGISTIEDPYLPLPDGVYTIKYSVDPASINFVEKTIVRVDRLQEEFDEAFLKLDLMECDRAIKTQAKVDLNTIYFFIQASIASANNCAVDEAVKLYAQAKKMLHYFLRNNCGCSGNNYLVNFH